MTAENLLPGFPSPFPGPLAMAVSPVQLAALALLLVVLFAPGMIRPFCRMAGRLLAAEVRRRAGLPPRRERKGAPAAGDAGGRTDLPEPDVEVLPPERPRPTLRASDPTPLAPPAPRRSPASVVWVGAVVCGGVAVLLWLLLHAR